MRKYEMGQHNRLGRIAERMATTWLMRHGYAVLERNWRHGHHEIDLIASKENFLHFVEVKARRYHPHRQPEDAVTRKKFRHLREAATEYLYRNPGHAWIRFDILSITFHAGKEPAFFLIEDVYL